MIIDKADATSIYSKIIQNLKSGNASNNKVYIVKNTHKPAFRINKSFINQIQDARRTSIDYEIERRPIILEHDKELENELAEFRKEVEDKYQLSKANSFYKFKRANVHNEMGEDKVNCVSDNIYYTIPATIYCQKKQQPISIKIKEGYYPPKNKLNHIPLLNQTQQLINQDADTYSTNPLADTNPYAPMGVMNNTQKLVIHKEIKRREKSSLSKSYDNPENNGVQTTPNKRAEYVSKSRNIMELSNLSLTSNQSCKFQTSNGRVTKSKLILANDIAKQKMINRIRAKKKLTMSMNNPYIEKANTSFNKTALIKNLLDSSTYISNVGTNMRSVTTKRQYQICLILLSINLLLYWLLYLTYKQ